MAFFGVIFLKRSMVVSGAAFQQVDPTHWVLDLSQHLGPNNHSEVKDLCLFCNAGAIVEAAPRCPTPPKRPEPPAAAALAPCRDPCKAP